MRASIVNHIRGVRLRVIGSMLDGLEVVLRFPGGRSEESVESFVRVKVNGVVTGKLKNLDYVDLVVLNKASPVLAFEAISGKNLLCKDPSFQAEFVSLTCRLYEDSMAMLERGFTYHCEAS
jgi:hypothetical protein